MAIDAQKNQTSYHEFSRTLTSMDAEKRKRRPNRNRQKIIIRDDDDSGGFQIPIPDEDTL